MRHKVIEYNRATSGYGAPFGPRTMSALRSLSGGKSDISRTIRWRLIQKRSLARSLLTRVHTRQALADIHIPSIQMLIGWYNHG